MASGDAARRYAQAAFEIAVEAGDDLDRWRSELDDIATVLAESDVAPLFVDDRIPVEQRMATAERVLDVSPMALNLARLLIQKGRAGDARRVAEVFNRMADAHQGIAQARVTAAVDLTPEQVERITQRLSESFGLDVRVQAEVDPSILGGIVVRVGDKLIDGSVRTRLRRLRQELKAG